MSSFHGVSEFGVWGLSFIFSECGDGIISAVLQVTVLIMPVYVLLQSPRLLFAAYMLSLGR